MTFIFECIESDEYFYVSAPDLYHALEIFGAHFDASDDSKFHIYVRIA